MQFRNFGGLDQRSGDLTVDPQDSRDLLNVDLHPQGQIATRSGMISITDPSGGSAERNEGIAYLKKTDGKYFYAATAKNLYVSKSASGWTFDIAHGFDPLETASKLRFETARYVSTEWQMIQNPDWKEPDWVLPPYIWQDQLTKRGATLYVAGEGIVPRLHWGDGGEEFPTGIYSADKPIKGMPVGDTTLAGIEFRNWLENPPTGFYLTGRESVEQMFAWGFPDDPNRVDFSEVGVPWNFIQANPAGLPLEDPPIPPGSVVTQLTIDGGWFYALTDDSDEVVGVIQVLDRILVFKRKKTLVYAGLPNVNLSLQFTYPVGCTSYDSVQKVGSDVYWWSEHGPVHLYGVREFGDLTYSNLGIKIDDEIRDVSPEQERGINAMHDKLNFRVLFFIPSPDQGVNPGTVLGFYYDSPQRWTKWDGDITYMVRTLTEDDLESQALVHYGGGEDGKIYYMLTGTDDDGTAISAHYCTPWMDFGDSDYRKRLMYLDTMIGEAGAEGLVTEIGWDYSELLYPYGSLARVLGSTAGTWGEGEPVTNGDAREILPEDALWVDEEPPQWDPLNPSVPGSGLPVTGWETEEQAGIWDHTTRMIKRFRAVGTGNLMRIKFSSDGSYPMQLVGWRTTITQKGHR